MARLLWHGSRKRIRSGIHEYSTFRFMGSPTMFAGGTIFMAQPRWKMVCLDAYPEDRLESIRPTWHTEKELCAMSKIFTRRCSVI